MARAIKKLRVLGGGFAVIPVGGKRLVQSVPGELNMDHTAVLQKAEVHDTTAMPCLMPSELCLCPQATAYTSAGALVRELGWTELRARSILVRATCSYSQCVVHTHTHAHTHTHSCTYARTHAHTHTHTHTYN